MAHEKQEDISTTEGTIAVVSHRNATSTRHQLSPVDVVGVA